MQHQSQAQTKARESVSRHVLMIDGNNTGVNDLIFGRIWGEWGSQA
jgi:hypothetical protein